MKLNKGDLVEVSSDEEGFRGAWFCGRILQRQGLGFIVEYRDLMSEQDETKPLREKVDCRHIRPAPPELHREEYAVHEEIDAFDNDGWWVGVVTKVLGNHRYLIYFMQTKEEIEFDRSKLRPHQELINDEWVEASKALMDSYSMDADSVLDHNDGTLVPYIFKQNVETTPLLSNALTSGNDKEKKKSSKPVRRSSRNIEKQSETSVCKDSGSILIDVCKVKLAVAAGQSPFRSTKGKEGTEGHLDNISSFKGEINVEDPEAPPLLKRKNKSDPSSLIPVLSNEGANVKISDAQLEAINPDVSAAVGKTGRQLTPRRALRKRGSQLDNASVSTGKNDRPSKHATDAGTAEASVGVKRKRRDHLMSGSSLPSLDGINATTSATQHELDNPDVFVVSLKPDVFSHGDISVSSLKTKKRKNKNLPHEANTLKGYGVTKMEIPQSAIPSVSPDIGEKIFTITIPHLEFIGQNPGLQGSSGGLCGKASMRELKLLAYHSVLQALYLQGTHTWKHEVLLTNLRETLHISNEEHSAELNRITSGHYDPTA